MKYCAHVPPSADKCIENESNVQPPPKLEELNEFGKPRGCGPNLSASLALT